MLEEDTYNKGEEEEEISLEEGKRMVSDWDDIIQAVDENYFSMGVDDPIKEVERLQWAQNLEKYKRKRDELCNPNSCEYESGIYALDELIKRIEFDNRKDDRGRRTDDYAESLKDINVNKIKKTKRILLHKAYEALHHGSPLRSLKNKTEFGMMWEDFDHRIVCQIINTLKPRTENGKKVYPKFPPHLIILAQGVYTELINEKDFQPSDLCIYDEYVDYDLFIGKKRYKPKFEVLDPSDLQHYSRGKNGEISIATSDFLSRNNNELAEAEKIREEKKWEKWQLYLEHDQWVNDWAGDDYKKVWESEKAICRRKLLKNNIKNNHAAIIVSAIDKLKKSWLANGLPIYPYQKLVKEYLYKNHPHRFDPFWKDSNWKRPIGVATEWTFFPPAKMNIKS